ncbi:MAG TPA: ATP-binding protein [Candidatus Paceibacterota bacterium]|nr:ATP-binding protein [Candidatus Paceibacterota bacterium]
MPDPKDFKHFELILETISREIVVFDADGKFVYANGAAKRSGRIKDLGAHPVLDDLYAEVEFRDAYGNVLPPDLYPSVRARKGIATRNNLFQFINKRTGTAVWYETNAMPIFDDTGKVSYVIISYQDVTEKRAQEDKLKFLVDAFKILSGTLDFNVLLHETAKLMVPTIADWSAIDIVDDEGTLRRLTVVHQDPTMIDLVREVDEVFPPDPDAPTGVWHVIKTGRSEFTPKITDEMLVQGSKNERELALLRRLNLSSIMTVPIAARGRVLGALTLVHAESKRHYTQDDLSFASDFCNHIGILLDNAKLYQEIEIEGRKKERFLAVLSHELRNPLAPISSSLEFLRLKDVKVPEIRNELDVISRQFAYMERILKDLLEVSRLTSGTIALEKVPLDLTTVVNESVESVRPAAERNGQTIYVSFPGHPVRIMGDRVRIAQVLINLLDNAIKFTPRDGSIWVTLDTGITTARISVRDNGIGIRPGFLPHIFDLYTKKPRQSGDKLNNGLGIGLVLARNLLELHGGVIMAKSDGPGKGSEFVIDIPLSVPQQEKMAIPKTLPDMQTKADVFDGMNILIADDNRDAANALGKLFTLVGAKPHTVYSGPEVLTAVNRLNPSVLIMDIAMPEIDGYELAAILRENGFSNMMIALTGYGQPRDKQKSFDSGFDYHLIKPARLEDFREIFSSSLIRPKK